MLALVVSDSCSLRDILKRTLQERGFEVATAASDGDALAVIDDTCPDLALIDRNLPEMSGFDLVGKIRSEPRCRLIRLILITAESTAPEISFALATGADDYLASPFTPEAVYDKLRLVGLRVPDAAGVPFA